MRHFLLSLVFAITAIAVQAQDPAIVITTSKDVNSQFSFGIRANAASTPIQIDWGNGVKENFTIGDVTEFFSYPLKGNSVKIWGTGIASLNIDSKELIALDVTRATSLTYLYCKSNQITTLDLSNCTALSFVDCSDNLLTSLALPNTSTLTAVNCDNNLLTSLNVSGAIGITELTCTNNKLTFATLPVKQPTWTTYNYSPQQNIALPKQTYSINEEIDLSSQLTVGSTSTSYTWKTASGTTLSNGTDYNVTGGKFTFLKTYTESFYCEMTNTTFPGLTLKTTNILVLPPSSVIMTTFTAVGSTFSFGIGATANNTPIQVDWGNGTLTSYTIGTSLSTVSGTLTGNTMKIYGVGINNLDLSYRNLTSLDVTNSNELTNLDCRFNQLSTLDVSKNIALKNLICLYNNLTSLDVLLNTSLIKLDFGSNKLTTIDVTKNTALQFLGCASNQLTSIDISKNTSLLELYCSNNELGAINISTNPLLKKLSCCNVNLTSIDLTNNTALEELWCHTNKLTSIDLSKNTSLKALICYSNNFTFKTLPIKQSSWIAYQYSPQNTIKLNKNKYDLNEEIDIIEQLSIENSTSTYTWKTSSGAILVKDVDYTENNGKFTIIKDPVDLMYCEITNPTFSGLTLRTNFITTALLPNITMTTSSELGSKFTIEMYGLNDNTPILIDWDNEGLLSSYSINAYDTPIISGVIHSNTIKIFGSGVRHINVKSKKLLSINLENNSSLEYLNCSNNQLSTLDVTKCPKLKRLYCENNNLTFSTLPQINSSWLIYVYYQQNPVLLQKKNYSVGENIDLSDQFMINSKPTNYGWYNKNGGIYDGFYNVNNGVTKFLYEFSDSVFCILSNANFPGLILTTTNIKVSQYPLSVDENEVAVKVYPNPATERFTVEMAEEIVRVEVYTLTGVKVFENGLYISTQVTVPTDSMPKGILLVRAYTRNGVYESKIVKI